MITQSYKLNIVPYAEQAVRGMTSPKVPVSQYDKGLRTLVFDLYDGATGRLTLLNGQTAKIYGKKPDGNVFEYDMTISEDRKSVSIVLQEQMAVIAGCVECEVRIIQGVNTVGSANFKLIVEPAPVGADEVYSESHIPEIDNLLFGGEPGEVFTKTETGAHWAPQGTSTGYMLKSEYDPNHTGSVLKADDADTVDGHTVARDVLANEYTNTQIDTALSGKVDTEQGKGLSTNDFTDALKGKLDGIEAGAQVNTVTGVKGGAEADYRTGNIDITKANIGLGNVDNTSDLNKPISTATQAALDGKVDKVAGKGLSTNDFTTAEKEKLSGIASGAEVNVQSDWNEADSTSDAFIQNKPSIPTKVSDLQNDSGFISGVDWGEIGGTLADQTDLKNALDAKANTADLAAVATSGNASDVNYDNTTSGLSATKTQGAIDELNTGLSSAVKSVNDITPDSNGNAEISASDIPANGMGTKETSGNPIEIEDGVAGNALDLSVDLEPIQDLHGYDHPWVGGAGKNKLQVTASSTTDSGITFTVNDDGTIKVTGTASADTTLIVNSNVNYIADGTYILNGCPAGGDTSTYFLQLIKSPSPSLADKGNGVQFTKDSSTTLYQLYLHIKNGYACPTGGLLFKPMIRLSTVSDATFAPYTNICPISGRTQVEITNKDSENVEQASVTVQLGQTVYGGSLNVSTGELVVDRGIITDFSSLSSTSVLGPDGMYRWSITASNVYGGSSQKSISSFAPKKIDFNYGGIRFFCYTNNEIYIFLPNNDREEVLNFLDGQQIVYELATPQTIQLSPAQLALLEGYNILTTDGDTIHLRYIGSEASDVQAEIDEFEVAIHALSESVAPIETGTASQNYAVGDYLLLNGQFCKVTQAISMGEIVQVGRNVQVTTVAAELLAILAQIQA